MNDRDELVDAIWRADDNGPNTPTSERIADAIRARWRLVPVEEACADTSWFVHEPKSIPRDCQTCHDQYRAELITEAGL